MHTFLVFLAFNNFFFSQLDDYQRFFVISSDYNPKPLSSRIFGLNVQATRRCGGREDDQRNHEFVDKICMFPYKWMIWSYPYF